MNVTYPVAGNIQLPNPVSRSTPDVSVGRYGRMRKHSSSARSSAANSRRKTTQSPKRTLQ